MLALAAMTWSVSGLHVLDAGEQGIVLRFGEFQSVIGPGLHWRVPWPIEAVLIVDTRHVETFEYTDRMLTADENIVTLSLVVQYARRDPIAYLFGMRDPESLLRDATRGAIREVVGTNEIGYILTDGRPAVAERTQALIQSVVDAHSTGITVLEANLTDANLPRDIDASVQDVVRAREDRQRLRLEAETYANALVPTARGEAARLLAEAEADRARVLAQAQGDTDRFTRILEEYGRAPQVTRERLYLEGTEEVMARSVKVLPGASGSNQALSLPLGVEDSGFDDGDVAADDDEVRDFDGDKGEPGADDPLRR